MHLDRDDLGLRNDTVQTKFGTIVYSENKEIVTLRGTSVGEYCVNVHAYNFNDQKPTEVIVQLEKVSPTYSVLIQRKVTLMKNGDEKTAFRFKINGKGELAGISEIEKKLLGRKPKESEPARTPIIPPEIPWGLMDINAIGIPLTFLVLCAIGLWMIIFSKGFWALKNHCFLVVL